MLTTSPSAGTGFVVSEYSCFEESPNSSTTRAFIDIFLPTNLTLSLRVKGFEKTQHLTSSPSLESTHLGDHSMAEKLVSSSHITCGHESYCNRVKLSLFHIRTGCYKVADFFFKHYVVEGTVNQM